LTKNKKTYSGIVLSKEGQIYENPPLDIKGLQIRKISTPKIAREFFSDILENQILKAPNPNSLHVFRNFINFEKSLIESIIDKQETKFLKPGVIKDVKKYKDKFAIQPYRATHTWNTLFPNEPIGSHTSLRFLELSPPSDLNDLKQYLSERQFNDLMNMYADEDNDPDGRMQKFGFTLLAIPFYMDTYPSQFKDLVYIEKITNHIMKTGNILLESLSFKTVTTSSSFQSPSNIIDI